VNPRARGRHAFGNTEYTAPGGEPPRTGKTLVIEEERFAFLR
jgi:hypothetical protein